MAKVILSDLANLANENSAVATLNANNTALETALDNTLSRDGSTPNQMQAPLDMNSNRVTNLAAPVGPADAVRFQDITVPKNSTNTTVFGTANEITVTQGVGTTTVSLPVTLSFIGRTILGGTFSSPTLTTPALGTPSALVLTNATGTPSSIGLANGTGLPISTGVSGLGTGVAAFLASPTSANLATAITNETGTGGLVFGTSPTITTPNIVGTAAVGNATTGSVGEYVESVIALGSAVALTSTVAANITSISLTAGDWDISGAAAFNPGGTVTAILYSISTSSAATSATYFVAERFGSAITPGGQIGGAAVGRFRLNVSTTTTVYLVANCTFATSLGGYGYINARRVR